MEYPDWVLHFLYNNEPKSHRKLACEGDLGDCRTPKGFALRCETELNRVGVSLLDYNNEPKSHLQACLQGRLRRL